MKVLYHLEKREKEKLQIKVNHFQKDGYIYQKKRKKKKRKKKTQEKQDLEENIENYCFFF